MVFGRGYYDTEIFFELCEAVLTECASEERTFYDFLHVSYSESVRLISQEERFDALYILTLILRLTQTANDGVWSEEGVWTDSRLRSSKFAELFRFTQTNGRESIDRGCDLPTHEKCSTCKAKFTFQLKNVSVILTDK